MSYRNLPPVADTPRPERLSMTLLRNADSCLRSAHLYLKHGGGVPSPELVRGTAGHAVFEAMINEAIRQDESVVDSDTALAIAHNVMEGYPLRARDRDDIRQMAFHLARRQVPGGEVVGFGVDPTKLVSVERKYVIPVEGWHVSCKLDLAAISGGVGIVDDWKTGFGISTQEEVEDDFQLRVYAVALVKGHPVLEVPTGVGERGGRTYREELEPPLGGPLTAVRVRHVYPMLLDKQTGEVLTRTHVVSRLQVEADYEDLAALVRRFEGALDSGEFPAIKGSHCTTCPAPVECPLPAALRNHAGTINSPEEAAEAAEWLEAQRDVLSATQKELRNVVKARGPVRYGRDRELVLEVDESVRVDQDGLREAVARAATFGEPVEWDAYATPRRSNRLKVRTLDEGELRDEA